MMWNLIVYGGIAFALFLIVSILAICRSGGKEDEMMEQLRKKAKEQEVEILQMPRKPTIHPCDTTGCGMREAR